MMDNDKEQPPKPPAKDEPEGDFRTLGYGHRAHEPDPKASYGFEPGASRVLPVKRGQRWRVPG
ncbi:MAG: hypothetical protein AB7S80_02325 [Rhizobiaceae bacterium]